MQTRYRLLIAFSFCFFACSLSASIFFNTTTININNNVAPPSPAAPYPSTINVAGLTGTIQKLTVIINGFTHTFPDDVDMLLVGPTGARMVIWSDVGGGFGNGVTNLVIILDNYAADFLPTNGLLTSGTFKPTADFATNDILPAPAPPYVHTNEAAPSGSATLTGIFNGTNPNGPWSLYIVDDATGDVGSISSGWALDITTPVTLDITPVGTNVALSWPTIASGFKLQSSTNLNEDVWDMVTNSPAVALGRWQVTNSSDLPSRFYRLIK